MSPRLCCLCATLVMPLIPATAAAQLASSAAVGACATPDAAVPHKNFYLQPIGVAALYMCAIDTVQAPISMISRATATVRIGSDFDRTDPPWARLCYRAISTGDEICGNYATVADKYHQHIVAKPPSFDPGEEYFVVLQVYLPGPWGYTYFYGFQVD